MTHCFKPVVDRAEALALLKPSRRSELRERAHEVTERCVSKRFDFCSIINARAGSCTEDCKWYAQSAKWRTGCAVHGWIGIIGMSGGIAGPLLTTPDADFDDDLEQMMLAFRIVFPQCCMTVSTREAPDFRDRIVLTAADNMSAGSRVTPGGYAATRETETAQFTLADGRSPAEVFAAIRANGQEAVFKTWDNRI